MGKARRLIWRMMSPCSFSDQKNVSEKSVLKEMN